MEEKREAADVTAEPNRVAAEAPEGERPASGQGESPSSPRKMGPSKKAALASVLALALVLVAAALGYRTLDERGQASTDQASTNALSSSAAVDSEDDSDPFGASSGASGRQSGFGVLGDRNSTVYDADGNPVRVADLPAGQVCVINYWATWCPQCVDEFPDLVRIYQAYGDRVRFVFLNSTDGKRETADKVHDFLAKGAYDVPVYYDSKSNFGTDYQIEYLPTTLIVKADGTIVAASVGRVDPTALTQQLDQLLG